MRYCVVCLFVVDINCLAAVFVNYCAMTCDAVWSVYLCSLFCVRFVAGVV